MAALSRVELVSAGTVWRFKKVLHRGRRRETSRYRSAWYHACCREVLIRKEREIRGPHKAVQYCGLWRSVVAICVAGDTASQHAILVSPRREKLETILSPQQVWAYKCVWACDYAGCIQSRPDWFPGRGLILLGSYCGVCLDTNPTQWPVYRVYKSVVPYYALYKLHKKSFIGCLRLLLWLWLLLLLLWAGIAQSV